jgi:hypothetical protein
MTLNSNAHNKATIIRRKFPRILCRNDSGTDRHSGTLFIHQPRYAKHYGKVSSARINDHLNNVDTPKNVFR